MAQAKRKFDHWARLGPYYAMFPYDFADKAIRKYCPNQGMLLDPFCGRGTAPYAAAANNRQAWGCDENPVAWVYAMTKCNPAIKMGTVLSRARAMKELVRTEDCEHVNEFQKLAWSPQVLGYLNTARKELNWRSSKVDRTLAAIILVHLHAKPGGGLSNGMRQTRSMSPAYAIKWWKERNRKPPMLDPLQYIEQRIRWRYKHGTLNGGKAAIKFGSAETLLNKAVSLRADMVLTSPPYCGVTNYSYDNWIRFWALGAGPAMPEYSSAKRYSSLGKYNDMIHKVFKQCSLRTNEEVVIYVRTSAREPTLSTTRSALLKAWPNHKLSSEKKSGGERPILTALSGDHQKKPGEFDIVLVPN